MDHGFVFCCGEGLPQMLMKTFTYTSSHNLAFTLLPQYSFTHLYFSFLFPELIFHCLCLHLLVLLPLSLKHGLLFSIMWNKELQGGQTGTRRQKCYQWTCAHCKNKMWWQFCHAEVTGRQYKKATFLWRCFVHAAT